MVREQQSEEWCCTMYKHISRGALEEWLVQCSAAESSVSWRRPGPWQALPRALPTLCLGPSKHLGPQDAALPQAPGHKGSPQMIYGFDFDFDQSRHRPTSLLSLCFQSLFVCFLHHLSDLLQTDTLSVQHLAVDMYQCCNQDADHETEESRSSPGAADSYRPVLLSLLLCCR